MRKIHALSVFFVALLMVIWFKSDSEAATIQISPGADTTIQNMIDSAEEGDTVLVASGFYIGEGNRDLTFCGKNIILLSENGPEHTVIDCEELGRGFSLTSGESPDAVVSGFTIQNSEYIFEGGCIYIVNSSPSIENCFIYDGRSGHGGAGIHLEESSSVIDNCIISNCYSFGGGAVCTAYSSNVFTNCMIQNNESGYQGAGLTICNTTTTISDCIITDNIVDSWDGDARGGGIYSYESDIIVERCEISNNTCEGGWIAVIQGGGIYCTYGSVIISDCLIFGNSVDNGGGGGLKLLFTDSAVIDNCFITGNSSTGGCGGGISVEGTVGTTFSNCLIIDNHADSGGGIYGHFYSFQMTNCTLADNSAGDTGGGIRVFRSDIFLSDCISVNNHPEEISCQEGSADVTWTNIEGGWPGEGNIDEDPLFVAPGYSDYRLLWGSPCIDSGNPDSLDLDGTVRDMGAHSFDQSKELIVYLSPETREIAPGDSARVKYTVCNAHPSEKNFGTAAGVRLPDGAPWPGNPLEDPFFTSIAPSSNLTREFEYRVPLAWPEGTYSLAAGVGYDARIFDLDHFEFTVAEDTTSR